MGVSWQEFWGMNPHIIKLLMKGHEEELKEKDMLNWHLGMYVLSAVSTAIEHNLHGKKAKSEYAKEPLLTNVLENNGLTEEKIQEKEIKKAILAEEQYMAIAFNKGLPQTKIK